MKKSLSFFIVLTMALTLWATTASSSAGAQASADPVILNLNQETAYGYLDNPTSIFGADDSLYITLAGGSVEVYRGLSLFQTLSIAADKFTVYRGKNVYLSNGTLYFGDITLNNVNDFSICGDILRTSYSSTITEYDLNTDSTLDNGTVHTAMGEISSLSKNGDYYTVNEGTNYEAHTIYSLSNGRHLLVDELSMPVLALYSHESSLYCLSSTGLTRYLVNGDVHTASGHMDIQAKDFTLSGDKIYLLSHLAQLIEIDLELTQKKTVLASASSEDYFYNKPSSVSARFGNLIVSDKMNNRLAMIAVDGSVSYLPVTRPIAASPDSEGNLFVLTQNSFVKLSESGEILNQISLLGGVDLAVASDETVYVLTDSGIVTSDAELNLSEDILPAKAMNVLNGKLSYYDGENVFVGGSAVYSSRDITSYALDAQNNLFFIRNGSLFRFDGQETEICNIDGRIIISGIKTDFIDYGDALIVNEDRHCIYRLEREMIGSANLEDLYDIPELSFEEDACEIKGNIVARTLKNVKIFKTPAEAEIVAEIPINTYVLIYYDVTCPEEFLYVLYDDVQSQALKGGYVYASAISSPLSYELPDISVGKINSNNTKIYKWPSVKSPTVKGITKNKNDTVSIIPFALNYTDEYAKKWFQDGFGKKWYRTKIDDTHEGFIMAADISTEFYNNTKMPDTNATVTDYALVYHYDSSSKKYVPIDGLWIAKDSRVKVETPFDSSQKYTKVIFYRDGYGTINIECYVETKYVDFDGIDLLQFVAIVIIIITLALGAILILRRRRIKKRRNLINVSEKDKLDM